MNWEEDNMTSFDSNDEYEDATELYLRQNRGDFDMPDSDYEMEDEDDDFEDDDLDDVIDISSIDFSSFSGKNLKSNLKQINRSVKNKKVVSRTAKKPTFSKRNMVDVPVKNRATIHTKKGVKKSTERILVPSDRKIIVEGVDKFMLSTRKEDDALKKIGWYKGKKLKELVLIINNDTPNDFEFELFNPSQPLDYLQSSTQNLNDRIKVAGNEIVTYSDVLWNLIANPTMLPNAKFNVTGSQVQAQYNQALIFQNKSIKGEEIIKPIQNNLNIDIDQQQKTIVYWDILETLGRPFIPDGMDIIKYKVLAGNQVVFGFYYWQKSLKKYFFTEARNKGIL